MTDQSPVSFDIEAALADELSQFAAGTHSILSNDNSVPARSTRKPAKIITKADYTNRELSKMRTPPEEWSLFIEAVNGFVQALQPGFQPVPVFMSRALVHAPFVTHDSAEPELAAATVANPVYYQWMGRHGFDSAFANGFYDKRYAAVLTAIPSEENVGHTALQLLAIATAIELLSFAGISIKRSEAFATLAGDPAALALTD